MNDCVMNAMTNTHKPAQEPTRDDNSWRNPRKLNLLICLIGRVTKEVDLCEPMRKPQPTTRSWKMILASSFKGRKFQDNEVPITSGGTIHEAPHLLARLQGGGQPSLASIEDKLLLMLPI
ncbi:unnamed protein product [Prunus armeniaca]